MLALGQTPLLHEPQTILFSNVNSQTFTHNLRVIVVRIIGAAKAWIVSPIASLPRRGKVEDIEPESLSTTPAIHFQIIDDVKSP